MSESVATPLPIANAHASRASIGLGQTTWVSAFVCLGYYLTAKLGFAFALQPGSVSTLWMPNAILLAGLLLTPRRYWPILVLTVLPAHLAAELQSNVPLAMVLSWFFSNSLQALIAAMSLSYLIDARPSFNNFTHILLFFFCGAFIAPFLASFVDTGLIRLNGWGAGPYWDVWRIRFLSNVVATLTVVPVIVTWAHGGIKAVRNASLWRWVEVGLITASLLFVSGLAFGAENQVGASLLYLPLPFLLWAAVRFSLRGLSTLLLLFMFVAIYGATHGHGPFVANSAADNAVSIQVFLVVIAIPLMSLAAVIAERKEAQEALRQTITDRESAEQELVKTSVRNQAILRAIPDMMFLYTQDGVYLDYYTRDPHSLLLPPEEFLGKNLKDILPPALGDKFLECVSRLKGDDEIQVLEYTLPIDNEERHFEARLVKAEGENVLSIVRDVTETRRAADALSQGAKKLHESNQKTRELAARLITAQEQERRRISILLHDDVSQNIAALGVIISRLKRKPPGSKELLHEELDGLAKQINDVTTQIRQLSHQLHPEVLEHVGLLAALESQVAEFRHDEQIDAQFIADVRTLHIPSDVSIVLYRVAMEAMRNISRHAEAKAACISLKETDDFLILEVSDSGKGFDLERAKRGSGVGLISAEERIKLVQGVFEIRSTPSNGTTLIAKIPLSSAT